MFTVQWGKSLSNPFNVSNGVRQGGILSPVLFNVFIDDLSLQLNDLNVGCQLNAVSFNHIIYADDTVLLAPSPNALHELILKCEDFASSHELIFNQKKTKYMCFKPKSLQNIYVPRMFLNGVQIDQVDKENYLGVLITDDIMHDAAVDKERKLLYARGNKIIRYFKHCSNEVKVQLFKTFCTGFYCASLWCNFSSCNLRRFKVAHNTMFKLLMRADRCASASGLFVSHSVPNVNVILRKLGFSLYKRIFSSDNVLIRCLVDSVFFYSSKLYKNWEKTLFIPNHSCK